MSSSAGSSSSSSMPAHALPADRTPLQLPRLNDNNFNQWAASLKLITMVSNIQDFIDKRMKINGAKLQGEDRRLYYSLANAMMMSMNEKARRIATAGYLDDATLPYLMYSRLLKHFNPMSNVNNIQLRHQLYTMR